MVTRASYTDLRGRNILITGGASGIGAGLVRAFHQQGAHIGFIDIDDQRAETLMGDLTGDGRICYQSFDLTDLEGIAWAIDQLQEQIGPFEVLLNNAASDDRHSPADVTPDYWRNRIDVNLSHQFFCAKALHKGMQERGGGSIINFSSVSYMMQVPHLVAYETAKAAVTGLTRSLAREWGEDGIRVNSIVPGCVMTERQLEKWITPETEAEIQKGQCLKRRVLEEDIAHMALFLASDVSACCTAQEYLVDAGIV